MATPKNVEAVFPLTPMQQGLLVHSLAGAGEDTGALHLRGELDGPLDPDRFREAWALAARRHPVLRTVLRWDGLDAPLQIVLRDVETECAVEDLRALRPVEQEQRVEAAVAADRARGLDLARPPTSRLMLFQTADTAWRLVWTCHHVLLDGWSSALVLGDVVAFYNALDVGVPAALPPAPPFRDYVRWLGRQSDAEAEAFWRAYLGGVTAPTPLSFEAPGSEAPVGEVSDAERQDAELPADVSDGLRAVARRHGVTLGTVLQGAWAMLLSRASGHETVGFDVTASGRAVDLPGVEAMAGMLINALPVRVTVGPEASAADVFRQVHEAQAERGRFDHSPPAQVHAWSDVPAHRRLSESLLVVENFPLAPDGAGPLRLRGFASGITSSYPLTVVVTPAARIGLHLLYDGRRFALPAMTRLLYGFERLLERVAADPERTAEALLPEVAAGVGSDPSAPPRGGERTASGAYVAPRDDVERRLAAIWEGVLNVRPVGMEDGFFDLGGQSVQVVQLLSRVEAAFDTTLPMSLLLNGGTPARMAAALRTDAPARSFASLVPLAPEGSRMPLYCVHSYDGEALLYHHLARYLGPDQPVYGLQAVGIDGGEEPLTDVRAMAARYVEEVRAVQPEGPYALAAICFGVAVALEMGRLLTEAGEEVAHLFALDSSFNMLLDDPPPPPRRPAPTGSRPVRALKRLARPETLRELPLHLAVHGRKVLASVQRRVIRRQQAQAGARELRQWHAIEATKAAWNAYHPTPYAGPATLLRSSAWSSWGAKWWHVPIWTELAEGGLTVHSVPGNHENMLTEPYVQALAAQVRACLDEGRATVPETAPEAADAC